jgi:hypothetical protein
MTQMFAGGTQSPSVQRALEWAAACAALRGEGQTVNSADLFLGILLAHPDDRGEMWALLAHFGLTARDLLPDDYPAITTESLAKAAKTVTGPTQENWDPDVDEILRTAGSLSGGKVQLAHVMGALLQRSTPLLERLDSAVSRFGIEASQLSSEFSTFVIGTISDAADSTLDLDSSVTAGQQIAGWLNTRFPRRPATLASFASDVVDPQADYIGVSREAEAFAYLIASKALVPPLAIGLFGDWGSGKTFLMSKIRRRVADLTKLAANSGEEETQIWSNIAEIEFNAWQYVETDLWAALLHHIFGKLTHEQRREMSEFDAAGTQALTKITEHEAEVIEAASRVEELTAQQKQQTFEMRAAERALAQTERGVEQLRGKLLTEALTAKDQVRLGQQVVAGAALLGQDAEDAVLASQQAWNALAKPKWRQPKYWTPKRLAITVLSLAIVPVIALIVHWAGAPPVANLASTLAASLSGLVVGIRTVANAAKRQQSDFEEARSEVNEKLKGVINAAQNQRNCAAHNLSCTEKQLTAAIEKSAKAQLEHEELVLEKEALTPGSLYTQFLSARNLSDDYRKRLGLVTTIHDDLEKLVALTEEYNKGVRRKKTEEDSPPNRIVLYVDDLDRCPPDRVVEVLEAVHLLLAFKLFVVIVAVDTRWLTHALTKALPALRERPDASARAPTAMDYIEKIFQIPFWVEKLDDDARQRLLRGLLIPAIAAPVTTSEDASDTSLKVGPREEELIGSMLTNNGLWLDFDARQLTITPEELAFMESLAPLIDGTPRQVKRFVNSCQLLLAMAPPLSGQGACPTERMATCFMAALHESMPALAAKVAEARERAAPPETLRSVLDRLPPRLKTDTDRINSWLLRHNTSRPGKPLFESTFVHGFLRRWDIIRRLQFQMSPDSAASREQDAKHHRGTPTRCSPRS